MINWIKTTDALPYHGKLVLCIYAWKDGSGRHVKECVYNGSNKSLPDHVRFGTPAAAVVTHWSLLELPNPVTII